MEQSELKFILLALKFGDGVGFRLGGEGLWADSQAQAKQDFR